MIYLLGGAPRTGKSLLAREINRRHGLAVISTDLLRGVLVKLLPELHAAMHGEDPEQEAEVFYPHLCQMIAVAGIQLPDCVIEGVGFFPRHVVKLQRELGIEVRSCFVGRSSATPEDLFGHETDHRVYDGLSEEGRAAFARRIVDWSARLAADCTKHGAPFIDLAGTDFADSMRTAEATLLGVAEDGSMPRATE